MTRAQVLNVLVEAIQALASNRPVRVGIDGRSGAGKTTLADELAERLRAKGRTCIRASLDDFHPPGYAERLRQNGFTPAAYMKEAYDYAAFKRLVLEPLGPRGDRRCRLTLGGSEEQPVSEAWLDVAQDTVLLADGLFLLVPLLRPLWDFSIWLDVDWKIMLMRSPKRDASWQGSEDPIREGYRTGWIPRHLLYEESVRPHELVDIVVDNSHLEHPYLVRVRPPARRVP